jgi:hypothetical protein
VALRVHVLDLVPFAGEVVQSLLEQWVALTFGRGTGRRRCGAWMRRSTRAPGSATRFEAAFEIREYDADAPR